MKDLHIPFVFSFLLVGIGASFVEDSIGEDSSVNLFGANVAHRGFSKNAPENTMVAFRQALDAGSSFVQADVRVSSDDVLVLIHDATVDRTTNGTGRVDQKTWAELETLDAGSYKNPVYRGTRIPSLEQLLLFIAGHPITVLLTLRVQGLVDELDQLFQRLPNQDTISQITIACTNLQECGTIQRLHTGVLHFMGDQPSVGFNDSLFYLNRRMGVTGFGFSSSSITSNFVRYAHLRMMNVYGWTANSEAAMKRMISVGVDAILTDDPRTLSSVLRSENDKILNPGSSSEEPEGWSSETVVAIAVVVAFIGAVIGVSCAMTVLKRRRKYVPVDT